MAIEQLPASVIITDPDGSIVYINPEFTRLTGYSFEESQGKNPDFLNSGRQPVSYYEDMWNTIKQGKIWRGEFCNRKKNGDEFWESASISPILDQDGAILYFVSVKGDITETRREWEEMTHLALHDGLTGLPNRTLFFDRLRQAVNFSIRKDQQFALIIFDLDKFKPINDEYGHQAGDHALQTFALRLDEKVRSMDTAARFGGDEFAAILLDIENRTTIEEKLNRLTTALIQPIPWQDHVLQLGASYGIAIFPEDGQSPDELIRKADMEMYSQKTRKESSRHQR